MTPGQFQLRFSQIKTATAVEKNLLPALFVPIPIFVILLNAAIFTTIYVSGKPIEFNGVLHVPGDPLYASGFFALIRWFAVFAAIFIAVGIALLVNHRNRRHWLAVDSDGRAVVYHATRRSETLVLSNATHEFDGIRKTVSTTRQSESAVREPDPAFFWMSLDLTDGTWTVKERPNRIILKHVVDHPAGTFYAKRIITWSIRLDPAGKPVFAIVTVGQGSATRYSLVSWKRFVYQDVGSRVRIPIRAELRACIEDPELLASL